MSVAVRYSVRVLLVVALLGALSFTLAPAGSSGTPYLSSLMEIAGGPVLAAGCSNSVCALHKNRCNPVDPSRFQNCSKSGGTCITSSC